ncbi:MAG: hypothetical protein JSV80_00610 [Acidobacteriota bacterium]|nr:MAG: hypothetical protein JSV80_00610 [Acidobacteriota bacterium]
MSKSSRNRDRWVVITDELAELCDHEQQLLAAGHLDDLVELNERRVELSGQLERLLADGLVDEADVRERLARLHEHAASNLALLICLRDELGERIEGQRLTRRAVDSYVKASL